ncbi:MAG: NAD(P)-dependent oxidoreductase [Bacteroidota bacterium]
MRCLIVDKMHDSILPMLESIGVDATYRPDATRPEILKEIDNYEGIIIRSKTTIDQEFIKLAPQLKWIARAGAGIDKLDIAAIEQRGISIFNAPEGNRNAVAEHVLGMILNMLNNLHKGDLEIRAGVWDREGNRGSELAGKTVGLLGYGFMGMAVARKMRALGCRVIAFDKYKSSFSDEYVQQVTMPELFRETDIFSIHIPLTKETKALVDDNYLSNFEKPIYLINTARGEVLRLDDLLTHLANGKVLGAGLDVLENEKINQLSPAQQVTFNHLIKSGNVLLSPHVAGWSFESYKRINEVLIQKLENYLKSFTH